MVESCRIVFLGGNIHIHLFRSALLLQDVSFSQNAQHHSTDGWTDGRTDIQQHFHANSRSYCVISLNATIFGQLSLVLLRAVQKIHHTEQIFCPLTLCYQLIKTSNTLRCHRDASYYSDQSLRIKKLQNSSSSRLTVQYYKILLLIKIQLRLRCS